MGGKCKGVDLGIERLYQPALHFGCANHHQLNVVIVAGCQNVNCIHNMMTAVDEMVRFFEFSSKKEDCLSEQTDELVKELGEQVPAKRKLKQICRIRWVERHAAFEVFLELFEAITMALEEISPSGEFNAKPATDFNSFLDDLTRFDFIVALAIANVTLVYMQSLSTQLPGGGGK